MFALHRANGVGDVIIEVEIEELTKRADFKLMY